MTPQPARKPPSAKLFGLIWFSLLALTVASSLVFFRFSHLGDRGIPFRQTANGFETLPPLPSITPQLYISDKGAVWALYLRGLSRLDDGKWHNFSAASSGLDRTYLPGAFAFDGEQVWAAGSRTAAHFDGEKWHSYPYPAGIDDPASIAASHGQAWIIDLNGNLSHFDGATWTTNKLDLPGVTWNRFSYGRSLHLAITANDSLWLVCQGLWRFDGESWTRVPGVSAKAAFLGVTTPGVYTDHGKKIEHRGGVWLHDGGELIGFDIDGVPHTRLKRQQMGVPKSTGIYAIAGRPPTLALATDQGLVWFDGAQWHSEPPSSIGIVTVTSIAVAPDQSMWGVGYSSTRTASQARLILVAAVGVFLLPLITLIYPIVWFRRRGSYQRQAARDAVLHATGSLPEDLQAPEPSGLKVGAGVVVGIAVPVAAYFLLKSYWPAAPVWLLPAFWVAVHVISTVTSSLKKRKPLPSDPIGPGGPPRYDWAKSAPAILGGLVVIILLYGNSIARWLHIPWLTTFPSLAFLVGGQFIFTTYDHFRARRVMRELSLGQYARAFEILNGPLRWPSTGGWKNAWGEALFFSGRAQEAEPILRDLAETQRNPTLRSMAFDDLGRVLTVQRRFDEAKRAFEASARLMPDRSRCYAGLAELRLLQGIEPQQALQEAEHALENHRKLVAHRKGAREYFADICGNQAWALGVLGRGAESQKAIDDGLNEIPSTHKPARAGFHWRAGMAMIALGNTGSAVTHFRRSVELDPDGYYGKLSAKQLSEHSVWGGVGVREYH